MLSPRYAGKRTLEFLNISLKPKLSILCGQGLSKVVLLIHAATLNPDDTGAKSENEKVLSENRGVAGLTLTVAYYNA